MATYTVTHSFTVDTTAVASEVNTNFSDILTAINAFDAANCSTGTLPLARISGLTTAKFAANVVDTDGTLAANSDTRIPSQKAAKTYVDTQIGAIDSIFGSWTGVDSGSAGLAIDSVYRVGSDGIVAVQVSAAQSVYFKTDSNNPPTTIRCSAEGSLTQSDGLTCPVKKDDYFKVEGASGSGGSIYWLPIGSGTCVKQ